MSENLEKLLEKLLEEQKKTSSYTLTLERDRLLGALIQAGLALPLMTANEFNLAAGATATIVQLVVPGFVYIPIPPSVWQTSLPWWCTYSLWLDITAPSVPIWTCTRMPGSVSTPDFGGIFPVRGFLFHQVTNNHAMLPAFSVIENAFMAVATETWDMIRGVFLDPIVADVRARALEISGVQR